MKRKIKENTSGSFASVSTGGSTLSRGASIYPNSSGGNLLKGRKVKQRPVTEEEIAEDEVLIIPGRGSKRKTGLIPHEQDRTDHEVAMARSDLLSAFKNAKTIFELLKDRSEDDGIEGWVQEKLIKANDYLTAVKEYYEEQAVQSQLDGAYGMRSCGCDSECDCGPDFGGMFESVMTEKSKSKKQQKYFGMVHALQKGEKVKGASAKLKKTAASMSKSDVTDFAKTKHSGLPTKAKKK